MNEAQEWAAYDARVNEVETAKAKKSPEKPSEALDADVGDMVQCGAKP